MQETAKQIEELATNCRQLSEAEASILDAMGAIDFARRSITIVLQEGGGLIEIHTQEDEDSAKKKFILKMDFQRLGLRAFHAIQQAVRDEYDESQANLLGLLSRNTK